MSVYLHKSYMIWGKGSDVALGKNVGKVYLLPALYPPLRCHVLVVQNDSCLIRDCSIHFPNSIRLKAPKAKLVERKQSNTMYQAVVVAITKMETSSMHRGSHTDSKKGSSMPTYSGEPIMYDNIKKMS
ncbi:hypothetical protein Pcac1_g27177 [Phytophthora cactorum]|nr:hypothetical protein Pcac1_g27177 [Phytophthora cactorum]